MRPHQAICTVIAALVAFAGTAVACRAEQSDALALVTSLSSWNGAHAADDKHARYFQSSRSHFRGARDTMDVVVNHRGEMYMVYRRGTLVQRTYQIGSVAYSSRNGGRWEKMDYARVLAANFAPKPVHRHTASGEHDVRALRDQTIAGHRYHVLAMRLRSTSHPASAVCYVDATTGLLRRCRMSDGDDVTFDRYDDPRDDFVLPASVRDAPDVTGAFLRQASRFFTGG